MVPLAVSGTIVIGVAVSGAVLLIIVLLRAEDREQAKEDAEEQAKRLGGTHRPPGADH